MTTLARLVRHSEQTRLLSLSAALELRGDVPACMVAKAKLKTQDTRLLLGVMPNVGQFLQYERKGYSLVLPLRVVLTAALLALGGRTGLAEQAATARVFGLPVWFADDLDVAVRQARKAQPKGADKQGLYDGADVEALRVALQRLDWFANGQPEPFKVPATARAHLVRLWKDGALTPDAARKVLEFDPLTPCYEPPYTVIPATVLPLLAPTVFYIDPPKEPEAHQPICTADFKGPKARRQAEQDAMLKTPPPRGIVPHDEFDGLPVVAIYPGDLCMRPQPRTKALKTLSPEEQALLVAQADDAALAGLEPHYEQAASAAYAPPGPAQGWQPTPAPQAKPRTQPEPPEPTLDLTQAGPEFADLAGKALQNLLRRFASPENSAEDLQKLSMALKNYTACVRGIPGLPNELAAALRPSESPESAIADDEPKPAVPQNAQAGGGPVLDDEARLLRSMGVSAG